MRKVSVLLLVTIISTVAFALLTTPQIRTHAPSPSQTAIVPTNTQFIVATPSPAPKAGDYGSIEGFIIGDIGDNPVDAITTWDYWVQLDNGKTIGLDTNHEPLPPDKYVLMGSRVHVTGKFISGEMMTIDIMEVLQTPTP